MKKIAIFLTLVLVSGVWAVNLLDDSKAKRPTQWGMHFTKYADAVQKDGTVKMPVVKRKNNTYGNVLNKGVRIPGSGNYILAAMVKADKSFDHVSILVFYKDKNGKSQYPGFVIRKIVPGKWIPLVHKLTLPEGLKICGFAIEVRDRKQPGTLLIRDIKMAAENK